MARVLTVDYIKNFTIKACSAYWVSVRLNHLTPLGNPYFSVNNTLAQSNINFWVATDDGLSHKPEKVDWS